MKINVGQLVTGALLVGIWCFDIASSRSVRHWRKQRRTNTIEGKEECEQENATNPIFHSLRKRLQKERRWAERNSYPRQTLAMDKLELVIRTDDCPADDQDAKRTSSTLRYRVKTPWQLVTRKAKPEWSMWPQTIEHAERCDGFNCSSNCTTSMTVEPITRKEVVLLSQQQRCHYVDGILEWIFDPVTVEIPMGFACSNPDRSSGETPEKEPGIIQTADS